MERKRFTWNARHGHDLLRDETIRLPSIDDEKPAGRVMETIDKLIELKAIGTPEGYTLGVINDDELDITGLVIEVSADGENWPAACDGWSEIDNYLPSDNDREQAEAFYLDEMVDAVLSRANRCVEFLQKVRLAFAALDEDPLGDPPEHLADAWERYQRGDRVDASELRRLDEWRGERAEAAGF
jgi:hypothetical protein